jgi:hypothetical protein
MTNRVNSTLDSQIATLRWIMPLLFTVGFLTYEFLLEDWITGLYGNWAHVATEVALYGATGPLLLFLVQFWDWIRTAVSNPGI